MTPEFARELFSRAIETAHARTKPELTVTRFIVNYMAQHVDCAEHRLRLAGYTIDED